jgi:uncharacterized cupredoxin-like copper-binding protein
MMFARKHGRLLVLAGLAVACRPDKPGQGAPPATDAASPAAAPATPALVHVKATDFKLDLPATIPAGAVTMHLMNEGQQMHQAMIVRLDDGKTAADLAQAMKTEGPPPGWMKFVGGPNGIVPGATTTATTLLTPGNYAVICVIPGPDGIPHAAKGMIQGFQVTPASTGATLPATADTVHLKDFGFESARPMTAGKHAILVVNDGPQQHELVLLKLSPGKSVKDFGTWAMSGMKGPPPGMPVGGVGVLEAGASAAFDADLAAGDYGYICFVPDAKDGKPHLAHGMVTQFTVQ